tara:strand:- start:193 stop:303 length:111 start_codon:yes stop_codon:yes gene_type:complete
MTKKAVFFAKNRTFFKKIALFSKKGQKLIEKVQKNP